MQTEDVFVQLWRNARLFDDDAGGGGALSADASGCSLVTTSSKYGVCLALAPGNRIASAYGMLLMNGPNVGNENLRFVDYPDDQCEIVHLATSHEGDILAVGVNRPGAGAFVELFDVRAFDPKCQQQAFPLASVRVSTNGTARIVAFSWNPCQNAFAVSTSDGTLATIQYELTDGASFTVLGSQLMKSKVTCISWSPKGKQLTVGDADGRLHQLKPELAAVRVIEAPNGLTTKRCVNVCWLSTTEWLVAYADATDDTPTIAFLTVKKQQPPSWAFIDGAVERNANAGKPMALRFCPLLDWQMVFICSSVSITGTVIAFTGNEWRRLNLPIVLPKENESTHIYPVGCVFDLGNILPVIIAGQQIPPQPVFHLLTATGWLISYNVVSLIERPIIVKVPEVLDAAQAKFGNPPINYNPRKPSAVTTSPAAQSQNTSQSQPSSANQSTTLFEQSPDMVSIRGAKKSTSTTKASSTTNVLTTGGGAGGGGQAAVQQQSAAVSSNTQPPAAVAAEPAVDPLVAQYVRSLDSYCKLRNTWTNEIDLVRELRGAIGDLIPDVESSIDSLAQMGECSRDMYNLIHESRRQLLEYELRIDESEELAQKMAVIRDFVDRDHEEIERELDDRLVEFGKRTGDIDVKLSKLRIDMRKAQAAQQNEKPVSPLDVKESKECTLNTRRVGTWVARSYADLQYPIRLVTELRGRVTLAQRAGKLPPGGAELTAVDSTIGTPARQAADRSLNSSIATNGASTPRGSRGQPSGTPAAGGSGDKYIDSLQTQVLRCLQLGDRLEVHARRTVASEENATEKANAELSGVRGRLNQVVGTPNRLDFVSVGTQSPKVVVRPKPAVVDQQSSSAVSTSKSAAVKADKKPVDPFGKVASFFDSTPTTASETPQNSQQVAQQTPSTAASPFAGLGSTSLASTPKSSHGASTIKGDVSAAVDKPTTMSTGSGEDGLFGLPKSADVSAALPVDNIFSGAAKSAVAAAPATAGIFAPKPTTTATVSGPDSTPDVTVSSGSATTAPAAVTTTSTADAVAAPAALPSTPVSSNVVFSPPATTLPITEPTNTSSSFVSFSFKPPTATVGETQQPSVPVSSAPTANTDEGMDEDSAATATGTAAAPTGGVTFSFNSMGLGAQTPAEPAAAPKNVFNMFSGNKPQGSSLFGGGSSGGGPFFNAAPANAAPAVGGGSSLFGGGSSTGAASSAPSGSQGSSLFGGGATFGSASAFNAAGTGVQPAAATSSPFANIGKSPFAGGGATNSSFGGGGGGQTGSSLFGGGATFGSASAFNAAGTGVQPAAATTSPFANIGKSPFAGGGAANSSFGGGGGGQTGSSVFGGGAAFGGNASPFRQQTGGSPLAGKPSAFTQMRK